MASLPCLLCGELLSQRTDKNQKPYFVCDSCGVQMFIRRKQGRAKLEALLKDLKKRSVPTHVHALTLVRIRAIVSEIDGLEQEVARLRNRLGLFSDNRTSKQVEKRLEARIDTLLGELDRISQDAEAQ